jgi:hypothetical protein
MRKSVALRLVLVLTTSSIVLPVNAGSRTIVVQDDYPTIASAIAVTACAGLLLYLRRRKLQAKGMRQNE